MTPRKMTKRFIGQNVSQAVQFALEIRNRHTSSPVSALADNLDSNPLAQHSPQTGRRLSPQRLIRCNLLRLKALRALLHFKFHGLTFVEGLVTVHRDRREVRETIFTRLALDESEALRSIKPLHCSLFLHLPASHAQLRAGRSCGFWNCVASLDPFPGS